MHRIHYLILSSVLSVIQFFNLAAQKAPSQWHYHFPLDEVTNVSGSFGEIRSNHFHSGVDFTTKGKTGWPVYAADNGYLSRIAVSPGGFGKALYISHPNGLTTVYGHLDAFSEPIDSLVTALQYERESFSINEYFTSEQIDVSKGEIIGFSGNSGSSGGPHLHFEVRETAGQRPVDPLMFPNPVKDDIRPHIAGVKIYPLSADAAINGKHEARYFPAVFYDGAFHLKHNPDIPASGTIGIGIDVVDYYTGSWRECGVHRIDLKVDDREVYSFVIDGFFFHNTRFVNSHIDYAEKVTSGRTIQKSFVDPYNHNDVYVTDESRGEIQMIPGDTKHLSYVVKDISGNESLLNFKIHAEKALTTSGSLDKNGNIYIDASQPFTFRQNGYVVGFDKESFYRDVRGDINIRKSFVSLTGAVITVLDKTIPVHKTFEIKIPLDSINNKTGLCGAKFGNNHRLEYAGGRIEDAHFVISARECGEYLLTRDTVPPEISVINPPQSMDYSSRNEIVVKIKDEFSGIASYDATIDGRWSLFEYDAKNDRIICNLKKVPFLEKGTHRLVIAITDGAGNPGKIETRFRY
ncbi:MAG: peptidase [Anaerophaga sp.]|uniref:M23 family metallopeptidase n=1 Tax=Anaerophaga thermohalophila TaxID=177400 RepID=UPI000237C24F|nr:M23 family metallopeptidase [Anaerophaga thermohalophila]MBZ4676991.1 peptidase [Anaerophaga sp.]